MPPSIRYFVAVVGVASSIAANSDSILLESAGVSTQSETHWLGVKRDTVRAIACEAAVPPDFALAVLDKESGFDNSMRGSHGEIGASQILPSTARALGLDLQRLRQEFAYNARAGVSILHRLLNDARGDQKKALRTYRAGPGWYRLRPTLQSYVQAYVSGVEQLRRTRYAGVSCQ